MTHKRQALILGFVAYSGTGKTTLLEKLIPLLAAKGLRVGLVKHSHHDFDIDIPGKDSYRLRKAGAQQVMVASAKRWALITEQTEMLPEPALHELLCQMAQDQLDIILVEGFKHESFPKIELHRQALAKPFLFTDDDTIIAIATDTPPETVSALPQLEINQPEAIACFIEKHFNLSNISK